MSDIDLIRRINNLEQQLDNLVRPEVGGIWVDWIPTIDQNGAVTVTITYARYTTLANVVHIQVRLIITGSGTASNPIIISGVPSAIQPANSGGTKYLIGSAEVFDTAANLIYYAGLVAVGVNDWRLMRDGAANAVIGNDPAFGLINTDQIAFIATYER